MAVLTDPDRIAVWRDWMRANDSALGNLTKADLRAAVDAIDAWVDANAASFNTAIPQPARNVLTARQKAWLLTYVVTQRWRVS